MNEHRDSNHDSFEPGPGWTWNVSSRGKHAGRDADECNDSSCVACNLKGAGRHSVKQGTEMTGLYVALMWENL